MTDHVAGNGGALGARVDNLEQSVSAIRSDIASLSQLVVASQKTPWGTLISAAGFIVLVLTAFGGIFANGMADKIADNKIAIRDNRDDVKDVIRAMVPRGEHDEHWKKTDADIGNLQKQIDQIRSDFGSAYSLKDALSHMQSELDKLKDDHK